MEIPSWPCIVLLRISSEKALTANPRVVGIFPNAVVAQRQPDDIAQTLDEASSIAPFRSKNLRLISSPCNMYGSPSFIWRLMAGNGSAVLYTGERTTAA